MADDNNENSSEEEKKDAEAPSPSSSKSESDELEELARQSESGDSSEGEANLTADIDALLEQADPNFKQDLADINSDDFNSHSIDSSQTEQESDAEPVKSLRKQLLANMALEQKMVYGGMIAIFAVFVPIIILVANRVLIPSFELPYLLSYKELTEKVYTYDPESREVPLFDDFRSKSHTMSLPQTVINLRSEPGQPAFGRFEFFLSVRDKELATIIETKQSEIIDLIQRTLEQISWEEMQSPLGKEKVKKVIRFRINEFFQSNIVIGVYYRSIILSK